MAEHKASEMAYRSQVVSKTTHINEAFKDKWDEALTSLSQLDPKKAAKEYWHTTNKLSGKGKKSEVPSFVTYKGVTATGHKDIAGTFA